MVRRDYYLNQLKLLKDQKIIKVVTGVRRSGKTTLLQIYREEICKNRNVKKAQIQSFNFEEEQKLDLENHNAIYEKIERKLVPDAMNYIFFDGIQKVTEFEELLKPLFRKENVDLYLTSPHTSQLIDRLEASFPNRYVAVHLLPFSFAEYRECFPEEDNELLIFNKYLNSSSFPETVALAKTDEKLAWNYLSDFYEAMVENDVFDKAAASDRAGFNRAVKYIFANVGEPLTYRNVASVASSAKATMSHATAARYVESLVENYLIYPVGRYDFRDKKAVSNSQYYVVDLGLRQMLLGSSLEASLEKRLKNIVFLELVKRHEGQIISGTRVGSGEVDFIVQRPDGGCIYYQVAEKLTSKKALNRELAPLTKFRDNYPKIILTLDMVEEEFSGIKKLNLINWLLDKSVI